MAESCQALIHWPLGRILMSHSWEMSKWQNMESKRTVLQPYRFVASIWRLTILGPILITSVSWFPLFLSRLKMPFSCMFDCPGAQNVYRPKSFRIDFAMSFHWVRAWEVVTFAILRGAWDVVTFAILRVGETHIWDKAGIEYYRRHGTERLKSCLPKATTFGGKPLEPERATGSQPRKWDN